MDKEKERLFATGAWEPATCKKYVSRCFLVPKPTPGSFRCVIDLRPLNRFVREQGCKYDTLKMLSSMVTGDEYGFSLDMQDGYHHISIHRRYRKYMTFCYINSQGEKEYIQHAALPFGYQTRTTSACCAAILATKPLKYSPAALRFSPPNPGIFACGAAISATNLLEFWPAAPRF